MTSLVKNNETFITLIQVALSDPTIRKRLTIILSLDKPQRESALRTFIHEMTFQQKPKEFIAAVACLLTEDVSTATLNIIQKELVEDPSLTESAVKQLIFAFKLLLAIPATAAFFWVTSVSICAGLETIGIPINPITGLIISRMAGFAGAVTGGLFIANRSWILLGILFIMDLIIITF